MYNCRRWMVESEKELMLLHERMGKRPRKMKARLAALNPEGELHHTRAKEVINDLAKGGEISEPESGSFIDPDGRLLPAYANGNHYDTVRELGRKIGLKFNIPDTGGERYNVDDEDIHHFLQKTGLVRVQHFPSEQSTTVHIATPLTSAQRTRIKHFTEDDPNMRLGFFVGPDFQSGVVGEGFNNLMREHSKQFAPKMAQAEDADSVFNMTYTKSKPTHVKKRFTRAKTHIQNARLKSMFAAENILTFDQAKSVYDRVKSGLPKTGYVLVPHLQRVFTEKDGKVVQKLFGNGKDPVHGVQRTNEEGTELNDNHRAKYDEIVKEGKKPTIGGWTDPQDNKHYTDVGTLEPIPDEEARKRLSSHKQKASARYDLNGAFSIFS
jgi:hypothetical protein